MWYHDPYMDRYRQTSVRYLTPKDAANGALADGIEQIKYLTHGKHEMGSEDVSFIRRMTTVCLAVSEHRVVIIVDTHPCLHRSHLRYKLMSPTPHHHTRERKARRFGK
ncbi:unnamed protein product, partial [Linum tenue]